MKAKVYGELSIRFPDLQSDDPVLFADPAPPEKLKPFRFYLVHAYRHFGKLDNNGVLVESTRDIEKATRDEKTWKEHIETALLVCTATDIIPARCTFKTTKTKAAHISIEALKRASTPDWAKDSPEHTASLVAPDPRFRFTTTVRLSGKPGSGNPYVVATGVIRPTTMADWTALANKLGDKDWAARCDKTIAAWQNHVKYCQEKER